jgi:glycosyltransferase involved in cell wall biosynthesis
MGFGTKDFILLNVGRLHPQKGQKYLIYAMEKLVTFDERFKLIIVGKGALMNELKKMVDEKKLDKYITFLGQREDVKKLMQISDVFVFPSEYEALGIAMIEAMAMQLPIVASRVEGIPEVAIDGKNALLFEKGDVEGLCECIIRLFKNPELRIRMGKEGRKTALHKFNARTIAGTLGNFYEKIYQRVQ